VRRIRATAGLAVVAAVPLALAMGATSATAQTVPFLHHLSKVSTVGSTVPSNGDVNPYGVALVPASVGMLVAGDVLVSNFNAKSNVQGTGTTIVQVAPNGTQTPFAQIGSLPAGMRCPGGIGLTTALDILPGGNVVVGSLGTQAGALPKGDPVGCLIVLDNDGVVTETFSNADIAGPWDMTAESSTTGSTLFVANALGGNTMTSKKGVPVAGECTVVRLDLTTSTTGVPSLKSTTVVGTDFPWKANSAALVLAPTGLALSGGTLFVDNSLNNTVAAIPDALTRTSSVTNRAGTVAKGGSLSAPLGMITAPNGDLLVVNGNNGVISELSPSGKVVAKRSLIHKGAGDLFGLALTPNAQGLYFVNDGANMLDLVQHSAAG
jgi:hypothetical protein